MKYRTWFTIAPTILVFLFLSIPAVQAQVEYEEDERVQFSRRNLGGPRLGITYIAGDNDLSRKLDGEKIGRQISQFGWHFEYQIIPRGGGPQFVVEFVPLVGGVEYGKVIPGATLAMGIRFPAGWEFGIGPNVMVAPSGISPTALVVAVGKSFDYGGVSIPLNLACTTNPDGTRVSFILGYAIAKRGR